MVHHCCSKQKVKKGLWSPEEDEKLATHITTHGHSCWSSVPKFTGLQRCGKSCRLRWINYLRPDLKRGSFNEHEERTIIDVHRILGNKWSQIAKHLPGRTDNEVKNFWNSCIKKKLISQGFDPNTHNLLSSSKKHTKTATKKASSPLFSISTTTSYDNYSDVRYVDMKTPLVIMSPSTVRPLSNDNSTVFTANVATRTTFDARNPNFVSNFDTKNSHCLTEIAIQQRDVSSSLGVLDEKVMWGTCIQQFELTGQEETQHHQYQHQHQDEQFYENCGVIEEALIVKSNGLNMSTSIMESSNFDFEFNESAFMPYGLYCNVINPMDQISWDC